MKIPDLYSTLSALSLVILLGCPGKMESQAPSPTSPPLSPSSVNFPQFTDWSNFTTGANVKTLTFEGDQLWMGLPSGIIRYDTRTPDSHEVFTPESTGGGLISTGIYVIKVDPQGNKWIGTYGGGLTKYNGRDFRTYTVADGLGDQWIYDIVFDSKGMMWVATWKGVSVFDGERFKNYTESDGLADKWVYAIALDQDSIFWFGTEAGISRFDPKKTGPSAWTTYTHKDGLGANMDGESLSNEKDKESVITALPTAEEASENYGSGGRHHGDPSKRNIGSNPNFVIAAVVDRNNHKWFGTWGAGLSRFDGKSWKTFTNQDGLGGNFIHALAMDDKGYVWAGTNGGASWYDGKRWRTLSQNEGLLNNNVFSIVFDSQGRRWFGTWEGLSMFQGKLPT